MLTSVAVNLSWINPTKLSKILQEEISLDKHGAKFWNKTIHFYREARENISDTLINFTRFIDFEYHKIKICFSMIKILEFKKRNFSFLRELSHCLILQNKSFLLTFSVVKIADFFLTLLILILYAPKTKIIIFAKADLK